MVLSTYLAYSLKLAVSMETAFPHDFKVWEEPQTSSSLSSSNKPLVWKSSLFEESTLLLPISASPVQQKHRVNSHPSPHAPSPPTGDVAGGTAQQGSTAGAGQLHSKRAALTLKGTIFIGLSTSFIFHSIFLRDISDPGKGLYKLNRSKVTMCSTGKGVSVWNCFGR